MFDVVVRSQPLVLAAVLLCGAAAKTVDRTAQGPAVLLPVRLRRPVTLAHAAAEALLAVALLAASGTAARVAGAATAAMFAVGLLALYRLRGRDPELGCGCFGGLSTEPVGWRALLRCALFLVAAVATLGVDGAGWTVLADLGPRHGAVLGAEAVLIAALSPELAELWARLRAPQPCEVREVPRWRLLWRLRSTAEWRARRAHLLAAPVDVWRHGCWWLARFAGRDGRRDTVFAIAVAGRRPRTRVVEVDARSGTPLDAADPVEARDVR